MSARRATFLVSTGLIVLGFVLQMLAPGPAAARPGSRRNHEGADRSDLHPGEMSFRQSL
jgi:hypothetical protein